VDNRVNFAGDYFSLDTYRTISTVDSFNNQAQISAKMGDSVAKANGRRGCMIEQYYVSRDPSRPGAVGQWDLTYKDYRTQAIRHHFLGACQFIYRGFYHQDGDDGDYALFSNPRYDFAPGLNFEPWFSIHKTFADEMARLSSFLFEGESVNKIAVLYPMRTYWAEGGDHPLQTESATWNEWLMQNGFGFDVVDEGQIIAGEIIENQIDLGQYKYRCVILPGASTVYSRETIAKLEKLIKNDGIVIASGPLPNSSQVGGLDKSMMDWVASLFKDNPCAYYYPMVSDAGFSEFDQIREILQSAIPTYPKIKTLGGDQGHIWLNYSLDDQDVRVAVYNDSQETRELSLQFEDGERLPFVYLPATGEIKQYGWFDWENGMTSVNLRIRPNDFSLLRLKPGKAYHGPRLLASSLTVMDSEINHIEKLAADFKADEPGLAQARVSSLSSPELIGKFDQEVKQLQGNCWEVRFQVPDLPTPVELINDWTFTVEKQGNKNPIDIRLGWEQQGYPGFSGIGCYEIEFAMPESDPEVRWELIFDRVETVAEIFINGKSLGVCSRPPYRITIDNSMLKTSKNILEVHISNTAGNRYYYNTPYALENPTPSGIIGAPKLVPYYSIRLVA